MGPSDEAPSPASKVDPDESWVRRLLAVGRSLTSELDRDVVLHRVLDTARQMTGARYAALGILNADHTGLENFLTSGLSDEQLAAIGDLPRGRGVLGVLIERPQTLRLTDISSHPQSYGFPAGHPPMHSFLGVPIVIRGQVWGNLYLTDKAGGDFTEQDEEATVLLSGWAAIAIDNAMMYEFSEARRRESERTTRGLEVTREVAVAIGTDVDLDRVLNLIAKRGRALVESTGVVIWLRDGDELVVRASAGAVKPSQNVHVPVHGSLPGEVIANRMPRRMTMSQQRGFRTEDLGVSDAQAALLVPMVSRGVAVGVVIAFDCDTDGREFSEEDEHLLMTFAATAANAVALAQSVEGDRLRGAMAATEAERGRWARELHDETLQSLAGLRMLLTAALNGDEDLGSTREVVSTAIGEIEGEMDNLRAIISDLRPPALDELGLLAATESLVDRHRGRNGHTIDTELTLLDTDARGGLLNPEFESTVYRIVQEALTNAAKHAGAGNVRLAMLEAGTRLTVDVQDDGCGFDTSSCGDGFGLSGMRERVSLAGGTLKVTSDSNGTHILACMPVQRSENGYGS